jgi:AraC-like DNA-binding protein
MQYDQILNEMEIKAEPFSLCELHGECSLGIGRLSGVTLHYILAGNGECNLRGHANIPLSKGTMLLVPAHMSHSLLSFGHADTPLPECYPAVLKLAHHISPSTTNDANQNLLALCGHITISLRGATGLVDLIRKPMLVKLNQGSTLDTTLSALLLELAAPKLGSRAIIRALLLQSMLYLFRDRLIANDPALTWMGAIVDQALWDSLEVMLNDPSQLHSVETLAEASGMSRSAFAKKFSDAYGDGPMKFLRQLRMNKAAELLQNTEHPIKVIAAKSGFQSRSAFSRTFENHYGCAPRSFRIEHKKKGH